MSFQQFEFYTDSYTLVLRSVICHQNQLYIWEKALLAAK